MKKYILFFSIIFTINMLFGHLCNDVFIQAKDNLAVKVDIRDGQLRINEKASFRVYLLNTMDRNIANINLKIISKEFDAKVKPSKEWSSFPVLKTKCKGGAKQYFEVTLKRKKGVKAGSYKIGLHLFNGKDKSMVYKTVDINDAIAKIEIPQSSKNIKVDGKISKKEWKQSYLATSFTEYIYVDANASWIDKQGINKRSNVQTRFRFSHDNKFLYLLVDFMKTKKSDTASFLISTDGNKLTHEIVINHKAKKVTMNEKKVSHVFTGSKVEIAIPLSILNNKQSFYVNMTRHQGKTKTYWRGNMISEKDPVVFANFVLK